MSEVAFTYVIYIDTTPKKLWRALTQPAKTKEWWHVAFLTDWKVGSTIDVKQGGITIKDREQIVLDADPHSHLAYTWHTFSREWGALNDCSDEMVTKYASERRSKVSFTIERTDGVVRLTMVHDGFEPGSAVLEAVSLGWPPLLSSLKTFLETGAALEFK